MVLSDWDGSYGYQITDNSICNGNDIMLGFNRYPTSVINDTEAATCVLALQQAAKNILYTVANSGNYTIGKACQRGNGAISCCAVSGVAVKREENGACGYNSQAPF